jgi:hypothetical protein
MGKARPAVKGGGSSAGKSQGERALPRLARDISEPPPSRAVNATFTLHAALFRAH